MADRDGDWSDVSDREDDVGAQRRRDEETSAGIADGLSFSLPPISLPEIQFPERIRLFFPVPEPPETASKPMRVRVSRVLLAVVLVDALDALAVIVAGPETLPWVRTAVGTALSVLFAGGAGLLYAWELPAILGGFGWFALAPTATVLVLARAILSE